MRVAFNSPARNQFSPGRPLRSRHRSEKPDKHVRLVPLAPSVTVAEWFRRRIVAPSTAVQFRPVTPMGRWLNWVQGSIPCPRAKISFTRASFNRIRTLRYECRDLEVRVPPPAPCLCICGAGALARRAGTHAGALGVRIVVGGPRSVDRLARCPAVYRV
jgi:hypothetical protein